jgi:fumarylacetoacetate (FAA) hydrolase family protein
VDHEFLSEMLATFTRTLFAWQRRRGRAMGLRDGETGDEVRIRIDGIGELVNRVVEL